MGVEYCQPRIRVPQIESNDFAAMLGVKEMDIHESVPRDAGKHHLPLPLLLLLDPVSGWIRREEGELGRHAGKAATHIPQDHQQAETSLIHQKEIDTKQKRAQSQKKPNMGSYSF